VSTPVTEVAIWAIAGLTTVGVVTRPLDWPEAVWATLGAAILVASGLLSFQETAVAIGKGYDVYLFLVGMMLLSEVARREHVFDYVADHALVLARGSQERLFFLIYAVGTVVTAFMSNDATAVVLTPAVFAAAQRARLDALPYLFICAFIANAASFILPISNPANIVLYGNHTPPLGTWLESFALPSTISVAVTYVVLRWQLRREGTFTTPAKPEALEHGGRIALGGIALTAVALICVSALDIPLGLPTVLLGTATAVAVLVVRRRPPAALLRDISWGVIPLVAGLFVVVAAIEKTGAISAVAQLMMQGASMSENLTALASGFAIAIASNLFNNLPVGLVGAASIAAANPPQVVSDALLIGVDLGPNLSVTGSLATLLWLVAVRREGVKVGFLRFLKVGAVTMTPALVSALVCRLLF
jgi:arsenical pump membrane protein